MQNPRWPTAGGGYFYNSFFSMRKCIPAFRMLPHSSREDTARHISRTVLMIRVSLI